MIQNKRPKQTNCQHEPNYPDYETVVFSIRNPNYYLHEDKKTGKCYPKKWNK